MFTRGKFNRLTRNEYLPEIIIIITVIIIIHICDTYYEYTGNQYILTDNDQLTDFCPLYPSTLQGKVNDELFSFLNIYVIGGKEEVIMPDHIEWSDIPHVNMGMTIY